MNVHDTEKVANLLHHAGMEAAAEEGDADLLIVNTCSIREKAEHRLYSDLGTLGRWKGQREGRLIGVGGCVAQQEGDTILRRFPQVDFVFGTHNLRHVPALIEDARRGGRRADTAESRSLARFDLPERHPGLSQTTPGRAFLTVMEGCDMFCSFCIVPRTRGREISRPAASILEEATRLVAKGVCEITLLGQTVNAYGRHDLRRGNSEAEGTMPFHELLAHLDAIPGLKRLRYTSPHPIFFDDGLIRAHRELVTLCPHVHLPAQSGSDRVLQSMRRRYTGDELRDLASRLRATRPDLVLTTDLIVGFPGERDEDFTDTLRLVEDVGFVDGYSFKYSARPGTRAPTLSDAVAPETAQERLVALQALQRDLTIRYHRSRVGDDVEVLLEGLSRRGDQLSGRDPQHRIVNFSDSATRRDAATDPPAGSTPLLPGDFAWARVVEATPHSLIGEPLAPANLLEIASFR